MLHLLKFSSIFLPLLTNKYFEVNGSSRSNFYPCSKKDKVTEVLKHDFSSINVLSQGIVSDFHSLLQCFVFVFLWELLHKRIITQNEAFFL